MVLGVNFPVLNPVRLGQLSWLVPVFEFQKPFTNSYVVLLIHQCWHELKVMRYSCDNLFLLKQLENTVLILSIICVFGS